MEGKTTYPQQATALRQTGHVMLKGRPCKITAITTTTEGKHGSSKVAIFGVDLFTGDKYEVIVPSTHDCDVPNVKHIEYTLIDIQDGFRMRLMDENGDMKEDLKVPEGDLRNEIQSRFDNGDELTITVLSACGEEKVFAIKKIAKKD
ncbi:eukaryotic translation initiation factor 5A-1-like [Branchiostoma floridae]|uniref:Eukaryotic translation initiation factor 5A n=1 Tax=Branchiostoma floridae TaxID=7739 RepID=A0A9J7KYP9_BRAFL|nr:eukaryotic translation initiation factor 5A-1-like [Branchiostoma floridae]XP_035672941.1 eukaryotic translation initiation factor 5A-1-like [Branchiostoma floridae]XP_035672942.1 eukaryotic translation initiation factor 5A-1-like [Branchiostoma floridae]XP_035672943.1 eukaryotic translation initiation factor 5A-1-like [Branchiostoma floridae]